MSTIKDDPLEEFTKELIAPFSIHRAKYAIPHGTVARKQFANRANKRIADLVATEVLKELKAIPVSTNAIAYEVAIEKRIAFYESKVGK